MRVLSRVAVPLVVVLALALPSPAQAQCPAGSICTFGTDIGGTDATRAPNVLSAAARSTFLASLTGVGTESFDGLADGTTNPTLSFAGAGTATLGGAGAVETFAGAGANGAGRYPTSGTRFYEASSAAAGATTFSITFSNPVAAFGFYGIDVGDQDSRLTLRFTLVGGSTLDWTLPYTPSDGRNSARDGSLLYAGFVDTRLFTGVQFRGTDVADVFAFDDMTIGSREQVIPPGTTVPEPSTYALLASGLAVLGTIARRRLS